MPSKISRSKILTNSKLFNGCVLHYTWLLLVTLLITIWIILYSQAIKMLKWFKAHCKLLQSAHTHTAVNKHTPWTHTRSSGQSCPGSSWGTLLIPCSVMVLRVEKALYIHSPHLQFLPARDSNSQPFNYKSKSLTIRPRLPHFGMELWSKHHAPNKHHITRLPVKQQQVRGLAFEFVFKTPEAQQFHFLAWAMDFNPNNAPKAHSFMGMRSTQKQLRECEGEGASL